MIKELIKDYFDSRSSVKTVFEEEQVGEKMIEHLDLHHFKLLQSFSNKAIAEFLIPRFRDECGGLEDIEKCERKNKQLCELLGVELKDLRIWTLQLKRMLEMIGFKGTVHEAIEEFKNATSTEEK